MSLIKNMNQALDYIEGNLCGVIDYQQIARMACCSEHQFNRMFSFITGISLSDYIRRRRLTLAALELQDSDLKVIDIAIKYGYQSPDSFSRAFQNMHGVTPTKARENESMLKAYPRMTFQLTIEGGAEMNYRFVEKESFTVIGMKETVDTTGGNFEPKLWEELENDRLYNDLDKIADKEFPNILHVTVNMSANTLDYYIGVASTITYTNNFSKLTIPAATWIVFKTSGPQPETMLNTWERIYSEWFPSSGYELAEPIEFIRPPEDHKDIETNEIWIPVRKKD